MLKFGEIRELIRLFDETSVVELNLEVEDVRIRLKKAEAIVHNAPAAGLTPAVAAAAAPVSPVNPAASAAVSAAPAANTPAAAPPPDTAAGDAAAEEAGMHIVVSPMVGTFYRAPSPDAAPFVERGSQVDEKTVVCIVEAMKLMNEIEAEVKGEVVDVLAENGQLVEYGQPLFRIKVS
ncbi:acetyl-CoA carboxylase biotin carboxyl carrier protein [Alicyclobacillus shizuokensis]|uniref:acetyl-CoA carboxylase biotin carboxyl carrier protein n=1 Tax=Alicyclobacillus shizuokensis TaxID=392014 RepID=UPI000832AC2F|nr:acetyl-CoA carboxylase biotin carboxyl carrier protein [Alicyclobacillus shizuokensis]MCL6625743.1 acetyl-CoA carboxylase biotin carboxyl carrier protein [Alicyclobacillus shizuokensis]